MTTDHPYALSTAARWQGHWCHVHTLDTHHASAFLSAAPGMRERERERDLEVHGKDLQE